MRQAAATHLFFPQDFSPKLRYYSSHMKTWPRVLLCLSFLVFFGCVFYFFITDISKGRVLWYPSEPFPSDIKESFVENGVFPGTTEPIAQNVKFYGSWKGDDKNKSSWASERFTASETLRLYLSGFPALDGCSLMIEDINQKTFFSLGVRKNIGFQWVELEWDLPQSVVGREVRIIAIDNSSQIAGWFGVSNSIPSYVPRPVISEEVEE